MTREQAKELLPIIQAFAAGRIIETLDAHGNWKEVKNPSFIDSITYDSIKYRIKSESDYRPFKSREECWNEMHRHPDFGWIINIENGTYYYITRISKLDVGHTIYYYVSFDHETITSQNIEALFRDYVFTDGKPFGIKV